MLICQVGQPYKHPQKQKENIYENILTSCRKMCIMLL